MEKVIRDIIEKIIIGFDVGSLSISDKFREHGIDSLDVFAVLTEVQDSLGVAITDEEAEHCDSIEGIISLLKSKNVSV
jgi:acyl carrier protein